MGRTPRGLNHQATLPKTEHFTLSASICSYFFLLPARTRRWALLLLAMLDVDVDCSSLRLEFAPRRTLPDDGALCRLRLDEVRSRRPDSVLALESTRFRFVRLDARAAMPPPLLFEVLRPADRNSLCTSENRVDFGTSSCCASSGTMPLAGRPLTPCKMMFSMNTTVSAPTSDSANHTAPGGLQRYYTVPAVWLNVPSKYFRVTAMLAWIGRITGRELLPMAAMILASNVSNCCVTFLLRGTFLSHPGALRDRKN